MRISSAGVLGGGAWGTALALVCARAGLKTHLWIREAEALQAIARTGQNTPFLPGVDLGEGVVATGDMADLAAQINLAMERVIARCPQQYLWGYARYKSPRSAA